MEPASYLGHLESIRHNPALIQEEIRRLDAAVADISRTTQSTITAPRIPGLIWALTMREIARISAIVENPSSQRVSDLARQARHLKALAASVPFQSLNQREDPEAERLL